MGLHKDQFLEVISVLGDFSYRNAKPEDTGPLLTNPRSIDAT